MLKWSVQSARALGALLLAGAMLCGCSKTPSWMDPWGSDDAKPPVAYEENDMIPLPPPLVDDLSNVGWEDGLPFELPPFDPAGDPSIPLAPTNRDGVATVQVSGLDPIYFAYDSYALSNRARETLDANAQWLKANPGVQVQVEGHCDERGMREYNFALGERRAMSVREYLANRGADPANLIVISYGEERPLALQHSEEAWGLNRRAQFLVYE
jgi:peptidoglycan-associated lipoprotein